MLSTAEGLAPGDRVWHDNLGGPEWPGVIEADAAGVFVLTKRRTYPQVRVRWTRTDPPAIPRVGWYSIRILSRDPR